jgi:hypothetical protein
MCRWILIRRPLIPTFGPDVLWKNWNLCDFVCPWKLHLDPIVFSQISDCTSTFLPIRYCTPWLLNFHILHVIYQVWCLIWTKSMLLVSARLLGTLNFNHFFLQTRVYQRQRLNFMFILGIHFNYLLLKYLLRKLLVCFAWDTYRCWIWQKKMVHYR